MKRNRLHQHRRGVTTVESAIVLSTLLLLLFAILDLGLAVCRYNVLAAAAESLSRMAIVRGATASPEMTSWGPATWTGTAASGSQMWGTTPPILGTMALTDVTIQISWPDAGNLAGNRVSVQVSYAHQPFSLVVGNWGALYLQATSTMPIVH